MTDSSKTALFETVPIPRAVFSLCSPPEIPALFLLRALFPLYRLAYARLCAESVPTPTVLIMLRKIFRSVSGKIAS